MAALRVGVREYCIPLKRSGSLTSGTDVSLLPLDLGQEVHTRIQSRLRAAAETYQAEYPLSARLGSIKVRGRCDGFFPGVVPLLEEIKSSQRLERLQRELADDAEHPYRLQILMYGYLYWLKTDVVPRLQLRLVDLLSLRETVYPVDFDPETFGVWVEARRVQIEAAHKRLRRLMKTRQRLGEKLFFPFVEPRPAQGDLIQGVRSALAGGRHLLLQAPTGLGKTAGVLYPSLQFALSRGAPVVYLAPKNSQFQAAIDLARMYHKKKLGLKVLVVTSKAKACRQEEVNCQPSLCVFALDYYDKVENRQLMQRDKRSLWDRGYFQRMADEYSVCPYEIAMERIREADLIICDYNYLFAPQANFLSRYQDPILPMPEPVLVIDEAHNLHERVREAWTAEIRLSQLQNGLDAISSGALRGVLLKTQRLLEAACPASLEGSISIDAAAFQELWAEALPILLDQVQEKGLPGPGDPLFTLLTSWAAFASMLEQPRDAVPLLARREAGDTIIKALCLDPAGFMREVWGAFAGVVAFSATLKPFAFYRDLSGFDPERTECLEFTSPFPREHKKILIIPQVQTDQRSRGQHYGRIAEIIRKISSLQDSPALVFFSSYGFLREVRNALRAVDPERPLYVQDAAMHGDQIRQLWKRITTAPAGFLILAVQGGSLAEGIDFRGLGIKTVFVVGPALPTAALERRLMQAYLEKKYQRGRSYAYTYPAMTKSIQAAGRIVRDASERGVIVLMDPRFLEPDYQETMPADWFQSSARELVSQSILADIREFWSNHS